ncbi:DUF2746 domain-containing protein [Nocardia sp. NPDC001965]
MNLPVDAPQYLVVLAILAPILGTWITARGQRRQNGVIAEVREQVANTHTTNLREDLDAIHEDVRGIRTDVRDVRGEVREVRTRVSDVETTVRAHLAG